jgi:cytochrome c553
MIRTLITTLCAGASALAMASALAAGNGNGNGKAIPAPEWESAQLEQVLSLAAHGKPAEGERLHHYLYCSACHGNDGNSPSRNWPSLTGQKPDYVMKTLLDYKRGMRRDHYRKANLMTRVTQLLNEKQMADLAAYYSSRPAPEVPPQTNLKLAKQGAILAQQGDDKRGITACAACHGERGEAGASPDTPALAGQTPEYFILAMQMYKTGMRTSDVGGVMRMFSKPLTEREIEALAHYYASLGSKQNLALSP